MKLKNLPFHPSGTEERSRHNYVTPILLTMNRELQIKLNSFEKYDTKCVAAIYFC